MKNHILVTTLLLAAPLSFAYSDSVTVTALLAEYKSQGATTADPAQGERLWQTTYSAQNEAGTRSCASCHTQVLSTAGKHIRTNKVIKPMSPLVNPQRLTDTKKVNKWFKRNCKWTMGRKCTAQEKADLLVYINQQSIK